MDTNVCESILSVILNHKGAEFISTWLASVSVQHVIDNQSPSSPSKGNRGRKAGAAPDAQRCMWAHTKGGRCKNSKQDGVTFCKIHVEKAALIGDDAASFVSGL